LPLRGEIRVAYNGQNIGNTTITTANKITVSGIPTLK
jgi:hypothetical protein